MENIATAIAGLLGGEWCEHPDAPGYFFSREGHAARANVRKDVVRVNLLKGCECGLGYRAISHPIGGGRYGRIYIHRAVCLLFNGAAPNDGMCVRHLDTNLRNNRASNLAWGTAIDNAADGKLAGKSPKGTRNPMAKLTEAAVKEIRTIRKERGLTFKQLASDFGVSTMTAYRAAVGQSWN